MAGVTSRLHPHLPKDVKMINLQFKLVSLDCYLWKLILHTAHNNLLVPMRGCSTFGGNPLASAVGIAALEVVTEENLCERYKWL
jgi:hypothetical protein